MSRIMVIGVSAGTGKSTFARRMGEMLDIEVYHLDTLYWKPDWVEAPTEEFIAAQQKIVKKRDWIMEGNYSSTFDIRAEYCDTVIYLELPLSTCLFRVVKRWVTNIGKTRPDMGEGCKEKIDRQFITFILKTYYPRKRKMSERLPHFRDEGKRVVALKNKKEIAAFLEGLA